MSAIEGKKMGEAIGVDDSMKKMSVVMQLVIGPLFNIIGRVLRPGGTNRVAPLLLLWRLLELEGSLTITALSVASNNEVISLSANRMPTPTYQPTLSKLL